ncbi:peptidase S45 penicillin amidase [Candidatus Magnetoovum chiemensis]|nr:peptidase S45 penicillin amidase [Candidatus Magnetoovum chiemensis]
MLSIKKIRYIITALIILTAISFLIVCSFIVRTFPKKDGIIHIKGLKDEAQIYRDEYSIPHIFAKNEDDLMFAYGYVHAQDRLWQLDIIKRAASGRLSEIFGKDTIEIDTFLRTIGFNRIAKEAAKNISADSQNILRAYSEGINAFIANNMNNLPLEFTLLRYKPQKWEIEDTLGLAKLMAFEMNMSWHGDIVLAKIIDKVGINRADEIISALTSYKSAIIDDLTIASFKSISPEFLESAMKTRTFLHIENGYSASNNWTVSGNKTSTGKPIAASDPHLILSAPSRFYQVHAKYDDLNVAGVSLVGAPGVIIGRNSFISWGITNMMLDDCDFYIETINPDNPNQYLYDGNWKDMEIIDETIHVKGEADKHITIRLTHRGPIVTDIHKTLKDIKDRTAISMRWTAYEKSDEVLAIYEINKAKNWHQFTDALRSYGAPGQNFIYADVNGNIGYYGAAQIPLRGEGVGYLPMPGQFSAYDWLGFLPFKSNPAIFNTEKGYIATANNKITSNDNSLPYLSIYWDPDARIKRIDDMLREKAKITVDDVKQIQTDYFSSYAQDINPYIVNALDNLPAKEKITALFDDSSAINKLKDYIKNWDYIESAQSIPTSIFNVFLSRLIENIYRDKIGEDIYKSFLVLSLLPLRATEELLKKEKSWWFESKSNPQGLRDEIIVESLIDTIETLISLQGQNIDKWQWGSIHTVTFTHFLGVNKLLSYLFNIGPYPIGGSYTSVNKGGYSYSGPFNMLIGPAVRQVFDMSTTDNIQTVISTGQSGQIFNPCYKDQTDLWLRGDYHTLLMNEEKIKTANYYRLILKPMGKDKG